MIVDIFCSIALICVIVLVIYIYKMGGQLDDIDGWLPFALLICGLLIVIFVC